MFATNNPIGQKWSLIIFIISLNIHDIIIVGFLNMLVSDVLLFMQVTYKQKNSAKMFMSQNSCNTCTAKVGV